MLNSKKTNILLAMAGAAALMASSPVLAQAPAEPTPAASTAAPAAAAPAAGEADPATVNDAVGGGHGDITPISMFMEATVVVKVVMAGLLLASILSWTLLLIKLFEFGALNRKTDLGVLTTMRHDLTRIIRAVALGAAMALGGRKPVSTMRAAGSGLPLLCTANRPPLTVALTGPRHG